MFQSFEDIIDKTIDLMIKLQNYDQKNSKKLIISVFISYISLYL